MLSIFCCCITIDLYYLLDKKTNERIVPLFFVSSNEATLDSRFLFSLSPWRQKSVKRFFIYDVIKNGTVWPFWFFEINVRTYFFGTSLANVFCSLDMTQHGWLMWNRLSAHGKLSVSGLHIFIIFYATHIIFLPENNED